MAICAPCRDELHADCEDVDPEQPIDYRPDGKMVFSLRPGRLYRSCDCQHGGSKVRDEPLSDPNDC